MVGGRCDGEREGVMEGGRVCWREVGVMEGGGWGVRCDGWRDV